jgi:hypothetical protein
MMSENTGQMNEMCSMVEDIATVVQNNEKKHETLDNSFSKMDLMVTSLSD